jgi:hypothetical protein
MSNSQNLGQVNVNNPAKYFNNYFTDFGTISSNANGAIVAYFESYTNGNKQAAAALASAVVYTAKIQGMDPMKILSEFKALPTDQLNAYLTMFLNLNRVGTSYLGINNQPVVNKYIKRSILV